VADFEFAPESESSDESTPTARRSLLAHTALPKLNHLIDTDGAPFVPHAWSIDSHRSAGQLLWSDTAAALWIAPGQDARPIKGSHLRMRLADQPVLNATVLDHLFEFPELIPISWEGLYVFFWGTIYRRHSGLAVRGLYLKDGILNVGSRLLARRWSTFHPAAVMMCPERPQAS
jgi:hypothetical protein